MEAMGSGNALLLRMALVGTAVVLVAARAEAALEACTPVVGELVSVEGEIEVQRADTARWQPAELGDELCERDTVRSGANSRAAVALVNDAVLRLDENTTVNLRDIALEEEERSFLDLIVGALQSFSRQPRLMAVDTPYLNATIEGTEFVIEVAANRSAITVLEGVVAAANDLGEVRVASGEAAVAEAGEPPRQVIVVAPRDAVQWALYYPPVLALRAAPTAPALPPALAEALDLAAGGRVNAAFDALDRVPEAGRNARFHVYRASLLLSVGQVEEAEAAIERALALDPESGLAYALRSVIRVVQNEEEEALAAGRRAVELSPGAVAPKIALSYALQARFQLEEARDVLLEAVEQNPDDPLAWARLAELYLSLGRRDRALEAARRASDLASAPVAPLTSTTVHAPSGVTPVAFRPAAVAGEPPEPARVPASRDPSTPAARGPDLAQAAPGGGGALGTAVRSPALQRALVVLGFANLAAFDTAEAKAAFAQAIELDPADPLPHFGFGLAEIREGRLEDGRRNIEVAVALNANSSILRSYLGKAYFEERRNELAAEQYAIAKALDPLDPTPYLYDALRKQTQNRPVEALDDLQTSIDLNDNRAVYRSRLQLDEDRAARGTSIARVYDDLGFQQLGLNVATYSLASDPTSASAHRFLSDIYGGLRRREIARVSELLQAQMLQHININPIQPSISETNLNIVTQGGPAEPGFNEFTPLFERDQAQLNVSGLAGNNETFGGEGVLSMLYDRYSLSVGAFHFQTDGWRPNADIEHDIQNVFFQAAITPELNAQVELRHRESEEGDLALNFDPDQFLSDRERTLDQNIARAGLRYSPAPHSDLLLSLIYGKRDETLSETEPFDIFELSTDAEVDEEGYQIEGQYLFRRDRFNLTAGTGFSDVDSDLDLLFAFDGEPLSDELTESEITHTRAYTYANLNFPDPVIWTAGFGYDAYEEEDLEVNTISPKLGAQWNVTNNIILRAAAFKWVKPALINNRTLEPTQVVGFNQLFDDINATESWRYAVGLDWRVSKTLFAGAEGTWRDLDEPVFLDDDVVFEDRDEQLHRVYLYWTPLPEVAVSAAFVYDLYKAEAGIATEFDNLPEKVETFSVPLLARYFHPTGFFTGFGVTYVDQKVKRSESATFADGNDDFFVLDASLGFRFPNRRGLATLEVSNILDEEFQFQDDSFREFRDEPSTGPYIPDRQILGRITLNF